MDNIIIVPFARRNHNGTVNAKNYPFWKQVIEYLQTKLHVIQIGERGEEPLVDDVRFNLKKVEHKELLQKAITFVSVDTWYPHFAKKIKPGVVIWGKSNPDVFGWPEHFNIFKDRKYFRPNQFSVWSNEKYEEEVFLDPSKVCEAIDTCIKFLTT